jgi:hypothetical protein
VSRVGSEVAWPVLQYEKIGEGGDFTKPFEYELEKMPVLSLAHCWQGLKWTKKIPLAIKNRHRVFWGMKPLPVPVYKKGDRFRLARSIDCRKTGGPLYSRGLQGTVKRVRRTGELWVEFDNGYGHTHVLPDHIQPLKEAA